MRRALVAGVGMTPFTKPGASDRDYPELVGEAVGAALADAGISYDDVEHACVGYVHADSTAGQRALYDVGLTGIPVQNLTNNCASGSSALVYARQLVAGGLHDCVLALGFEKMARGSLPTQKHDGIANPVERFLETSKAIGGTIGAPAVLELFRNAAHEHTARFGTTDEQWAKVAEKNHRHSVENPRAQFRDEYTLDEILASPLVCDPLTKLQCSPTSDGSAAAIVVSEDFAERHGLAEDRLVEIAGQAMATDTATTFESGSAMSVVGWELSEAAARRAYEQAGLGPHDVEVIELHDCFSVNELITYEALGLCERGEGGRLVDDGDTTYGGRWVVSPSGGLISKGHPLGATGLAQCAELTWQLRGEAGPRQVEGRGGPGTTPRAALQHNVGIGSAGVVTIYRSLS